MKTLFESALKKGGTSMDFAGGLLKCLKEKKAC